MYGCSEGGTEQEMEGGLSKTQGSHPGGRAKHLLSSHLASRRGGTLVEKNRPITTCFNFGGPASGGRAGVISKVK